MSELNKHLPSTELEIKQLESVEQQLGVIMRSMDMIPETSSLGQYLLEPAKVPHVDGYNRTIYLEANHTVLDEIKSDTVTALEDFRNGKIGTISLLGGSVNGHNDAHKGTGIKNLRTAFEHLNHFNLTGSTSFHDMLNTSGKVVGQLEPESIKQGVGPANSTALARGAINVVDGARAVMFNDYNNKPGTKMYGMIDPRTGDVLPNTFMLIMSGTYGDKEGTSSHFSNLATARIVLIPDQIIDTVRHESATEPAFDIESVDWNLFQGDFKVHRSGNRVDNGGWQINEVFEKDGVYKAVITSWNKEQGAIKKTVAVKDLVDWQKDK